MGAAASALLRLFRVLEVGKRNFTFAPHRPRSKKTDEDKH
ncbi:hypothetical protein EC9_22830 [Rosistilla ulvae]|uniref:Uncharacterized protein n=1 Tax=Rosistilla ulvae TaxID=1930277 RepID=A0A517LZP5_9BACT|nr:hypothetical protein EC9_22830 [Rosistilla ulvae]